MRTSLKLLVYLFLLSIKFLRSQRPPTEQDKNIRYGTNFRAAECSSVDNKTAYFTFCYVKAHSRTLRTLNFGFYVENAPTVFIRIVGFYRYGNIYREILDSKTVNWCEIMKNVDYNLFLKLCLDMIRDSVPNLFHKCPYKGLNEFYNISLNNEVGKSTSIFPEGQYKYTIHLSIEPDTAMLVLTVFTEIKSPLKKSFG